MRRVHNIFEPKATRVLRVLLTNPERAWKIRGLAEEVSISPGYAHAVISTLMDLGYVVRTKGYKIRMINPTVLLRRWAAYYQYDKMNTFLEYYTFEREIERLINRISEIRNPNYAVTSLAGAFLVAPHVRPVDVHLYIHEKDDATVLASALNLQPIPKKGNVKFVVPYDDGVFYGRQKANIWISESVVSDVNVVSNIQLFADLYNYPARGMEAAEHLFKFIVEEWGKAVYGDVHV